MDTPERLRASAAEHEAKKEESFERCDTDGFLSQWAHGLSAERDRRQAEILEHGGTFEFPGLYDSATGRRLAAKLIPTRYGRCWVLVPAEEATLGRKFVPFQGWLTAKPNPTQKRLGLEERMERAPAKAVIDGKGHGLSGHAWVAVKRMDGGYPGAKVTA